jgi:uncharacterized protein (DUF58 family)
MRKMQAQRAREVARAVRLVALRARRLVDERVPAGREAAPGHGAAHVKTFAGEGGRTILLMIDLSVSGRYGSARAPKRELAAEAAGVLAFAAARNGHRVGALLFTDRVELYLPPRKGRSHALRIIREILFREPTGRGTDLCVALDHASRLLKRRALAFLVSDFLLPGQIAVELTRLAQRLLAARRHHDVVAVSVSDPRELELPDLGVVTLEDVETGERIEIDTSREATRESYRRAAERYQQVIARCLKLGGIDRLQLSTARPGLPALVAFLSGRRARRAS